MLPSTLDMVPSPSPWNPRPSTLDKKIDSLGFVCSPSFFSLPTACRLFSRGVIFTRARGFSRSTIPEEKWGTTRSLVRIGSATPQTGYNTRHKSFKQKPFVLNFSPNFLHTLFTGLFYSAKRNEIQGRRRKDAY